MPYTAKTSGYMLNKVKISKNLLTNTINLLENLDIDDYSPEIIQLYGYVLFAFNKKKADIDFRNAFVRFINAEDVQARFESLLECPSIFNDDVHF